MSRAHLRAEGGEREGQAVALSVGDAGPIPELGEGSNIRVVKNEVPPGVQTEGLDAYALVDLDRRSPMLWLVAAFAFLVILFGGYAVHSR